MKIDRDLSTITFVTTCGRYQFTVLKSFTEQHPNYATENLYTLNAVFGMGNYLHNTKGPAYINLEGNHKYYFLNGVQLSEKQQRDMLFYNNVDRILEDDDE